MVRRVLKVALLFASVWLLSSCSAPEIAQSIEHPEMSKEQIHQGLLSDDMAVKLEAEQQLVKFSPEERLALLDEIRQQGDRSARLLVVEQLSTMKGDTEARNMLVDIEANDPDRMVKMKAKRVLKEFDGPTADPATELTADPTADPATEPTADPATEPTAEPTTEPEAEPATDKDEAGEETSPAESQVGR